MENFLLLTAFMYFPFGIIIFSMFVFQFIHAFKLNMKYPGANFKINSRVRNAALLFILDVIFLISHYFM